MIKALSSSLSLRLLSIFVATAVLIIVLLTFLFSRGMSGQWRYSIQPHLVQYIEFLQQDLGTPPEPERADSLSARLPVNIHIYRDEQFVHATTPQHLQLDTLRFKPVNDFNSRRNGLQSVKNTSIVQQAAVSRSRNPRQHILRLSDPPYTVYYELNRNNASGPRLNRYGDELLLALAAVALILLGSYLMIRQQLSPIRQVQKGVGIMSQGKLDYRINRQGHSDLDKLANSIDEMAASLQAMLDAKRQLLMSVSHELRSPVTRARITSELLPESRNRDRLLEDLQDMERMIHDIMESEQLQSNHSVLNKEMLNIYQLFKDELQAIAPDVPLNVSENVETLLIHADATRLRILLRNLVSNAMEHGRNEDGSLNLDVTMSADPDHFFLQVRDQGPGIAKEHISVIADPFYRPDPSRSRATGGFGLGLSLSRAIVEAHEGTLSIASNPEVGKGTCVTVELPVRR